MDGGRSIGRSDLNGGGGGGGEGVEGEGKGGGGRERICQFKNVIVMGTRFYALDEVLSFQMEANWLTMVKMNRSVGDFCTLTGASSFGSCATGFGKTEVEVFFPSPSLTHTHMQKIFPASSLFPHFSCPLTLFYP